MSAEMFEIVIKGRLSPMLLTAIDGFEVTRCDHGLTYLVGWVPDQTRLHGIMDLLQDLNIELASINPVSSQELPHGRAHTQGDPDV